ncbi:hypothetical protein NPIL_613531 [Nephila pilipes]|uniref:Uncharacterized protein n=1 Tax=Nephila pilipes TaxID=299642 RepID=A0A8X6QUA1_NEPPI|nr:hypothetical protein NPIL_613531 [Nephila pilipes]
MANAFIRRNASAFPPPAKQNGRLGDLRLARYANRYVETRFLLFQKVSHLWTGKAGVVNGPLAEKSVLREKAIFHHIYGPSPQAPTPWKNKNERNGIMEKWDFDEEKKAEDC